MLCCWFHHGHGSQTTGVEPIDKMTIRKVTNDGRLVPLGKRDRGPDPRQEHSTRANRGRRWMKLRAQVLARDPVCQVCQRAASAQVDHIKPLCQGGGDSYDNLQGICIACHATKSAQERHPERASMSGTEVRQNPYEVRHNQ